MEVPATDNPMEVRLFPNLRSPGVGLKPRRESLRPLLPQHARHCPVLEAGSALGFLVYPPLEPRESFHIEYQGEGRYLFVYYVNPTGVKLEAIFSVMVSLPVGGVGLFKEEVTFVPGIPQTSREVALQIMRRFTVPEDLGTPAGGVTLRGAWNFQTPSGWDTVYSAVFNSIERPVAPMLVVRVETDWYAHESEFRYVLQPGEVMSVDHTMPIGQAFFLPREPITLRECSEDEVAAVHRSQDEFSREKTAMTINTAYGLPYSPHYFRKSRSLSQTAGQGAQEASSTLESHPGPVRDEGPTTRQVGRNDPCPCGSGKKYKKCHGAHPQI
jgi:hypothetical protein